MGKREPFFVPLRERRIAEAEAWRRWHEAHPGVSLLLDFTTVQRADVIRQIECETLAILREQHEQNQDTKH